ncbi:MAG TPA: hypothetical protein VGB53_09775 [Rubricoccaceae bacterium]|jgi:hypothetical protein
MRRTVTVVRVLLGLLFFVIGLNGVLNVFPWPPMPTPGGAFLDALASGHVMTLVKLV